ncbi:hypothetical protein PBI_SQUIRTY_54 [Mycobacterium phage Squirty]|uniref:Uncharacterized protein n=1 Tax=Mycobacterium phage Squirty TaxID=1527512 RepID=A0A088FBJ9_9CAUD|nr:hypothetical protein PBI_SQUIRTY_54 [Mycobacterium phage Squirty]AIM41001.1 hypothetical protein PBI_SQUIRTY_54 [Mycobacterium phage Squirty]
MSDVVERAYEFIRSIQGRVIEYATEHDAVFGERQGELLRDLLAEVERLRAEKLGLEISESNLLVELRDEVERLRPRVIETVEQLDALPIRSLVRSDIGEVFERLRGGWDCLHEDGSAGLVMPFAIRLPARVLYTPAAVGE